MLRECRRESRVSEVPSYSSGRLGRGWLLDKTVELARVLAGDLLDVVLREGAELLLDVLRRLRPHAVGVRIVGTPHQRLDAHVVDELGADRVELERGLALP